MRRILACVGVFVLLIFLALPFRVAAAQALPIGFSQIKTRSATAGDEFVELFNPNELAVELNGYKIVKETASGTAYTILTFGQEQIQAQSFVLLALEGSSFAAQADKVYKTALADNNTLKLFDPNGVLIDVLSWGDGKALANQPADQSYQRLWQAASTTWTNWQLEPFASAHHSGDVLTVSAPLEETVAVEQTNTPTEPAPSAPVAPTPVPLPPIRINEIQMLVTAQDQPWVELVFDADVTVDALKLLIDEQIFASLSGAFHNGHYAVVYAPASLSTAGHTITLQTTSGETIDTLLYPAQTDNTVAYARFDSASWQWTTLATSGRPNVLMAPMPAPVCEATTPIITPDPTPAPTSPSTLRNDGRVTINEVFANPSGDEAMEEFIELLNEEDYALTLSGWKITDASKSTALPAIRVEAHGFVVLRRAQSSLTLNNGAETVSLFNASGQLVASLSYDTVAEDKSWNTGEPWYEAIPTPGAINALIAVVTNEQPAPITAPSSETLITTPPVLTAPSIEAEIATATHIEPSPDDAVAVAADKTTSFKKAINRPTSKETTFAKWPNVKANTKITIIGVITVPPGIFGEKSATLQDITGAFPGIELYFSAADGPSLDEGDIVSVTGKKSSAKTGDRMLISSADDCVVLDHTAADAAPVSIGKLSAKQHRTLVSIEARIVENKNGVLTVTSETAQLRVSLKKAGLEVDLGKLPAESTLTGIYINGKTPELWLRTLDDIEVIKVNDAVVIANASTDEKTTSNAALSSTDVPQTTISAAPSSTKPTPWVAPLAAVGSAGGLSWYFFQDTLRQHGLKLIEKLRK